MAMTVQLELPLDVEQRLLAEVQAGRHRSIEEAILEKLSRDEDSQLMFAMGMGSAELRKDLDEAWTIRKGAVDGESVFARIAATSAPRRANGE
jgi:hypothetical protein